MSGVAALLFAVSVAATVFYPMGSAWRDSSESQIIVTGSLPIAHAAQALG